MSNSLNLHITLINLAIVLIVIIALFTGYPMAILALTLLSPPVIVSADSDDKTNAVAQPMGFVPDTEWDD